LFAINRFNSQAATKNNISPFKSQVFIRVYNIFRQL